MSVDYKTYVYTPVIPLDVVFDLTKRAIRAALGDSQLDIELNASSAGIYTLHFKEDEQKTRMLWLMTQIVGDFPNADKLAEQEMENIDPRIGTVNDAISISFGAFGKAKEIMDEVGIALSFLGPVLHSDDSVNDGEFFKGAEDLSLEEVMTRYNLSLYSASNTLMGLRRGGVSGYGDLEAWTYEQTYESGREDTVKPGSFAAARDEAAPALDM